MRIQDSKSTLFLYWSSTHTMHLQHAFVDQSSQALLPPCSLAHQNTPVSTGISAQTQVLSKSCSSKWSYTKTKQKIGWKHLNLFLPLHPLGYSSIHPSFQPNYSSVPYLSFRKQIQNWSVGIHLITRGPRRHTFGEGKGYVLQFSHRTAHACFWWGSQSTLRCGRQL